MTKKLVIFAALIGLCSGAFAQERSTGNYQVSLLLGNTMMFNQELNYVLPKYSVNSTTVGIGLAGTDAKSNDPGMYLNFNELGSNSLVNMAGIQGNYYLSDAIDVNLMFAMDLRATPKKDYIEGESCFGMAVQSSKYINGQLTCNWMVNAGSNYHFSVSNNRIDLYAGAQVGYQQGRIKVVTPYTGDIAGDEVIYLPQDKAGQVKCITGALVGGISYSLAPGLLLGLEVSPFSYQYSLLEVHPTGMNVYQANNHACRFFASPHLKLGFRF